MQTILTAWGGWPFVALVVAVLALLLFRAPLIALINRTKSVSVGRDGLSTQGLEQQKVEATGAVVHAGGALTNAQNGDGQITIGKAALELMLNVPDTPLLIATINNFDEDLKRRGLDTNNDAARVLLRYVAISQIFLEFETIYLSIFGSQIRLLKDLNESKGRAQLTVAAFYVGVQAANTELDTFSLDGYLSYLVTHNLIALNNGTWFLTPKGSDFLVWMARLGRTENRPH